MNRDDIIRMAREAGLGGNVHYGSLERFAALGAAAEREAWRNAAIRGGENLATCGPAGYYDFASQQWLDWALDATSKMQDDYMQLGACGEREACAKVCEDMDTTQGRYLSHAIRARGN